MDISIRNNQINTGRLVENLIFMILYLLESIRFHFKIICNFDVSLYLWPLCK